MPHPSADTIKNFCLSHQNLLSVIDRIQLSARVYSQARVLLKDFQDAMAAHFQQQDHSFYGALLERHRGDKNAVKMIEFLQHDLKQLKVEYLIFCDKYQFQVSDVTARNFPKDFLALARNLADRFQVEEEQLFPLLKDKYAS